MSQEALYRTGQEVKSLKKYSRFNSSLNSTQQEEPVLQTILDNTVAIQLPSYCNVNCTFCGLSLINADRKYEQFSEKELEILFSNPLRSARMLYYFSDPFEFKEGEKRYRDIHGLALESGLGPLYVSTSVPVGAEQEVIDGLINGFVNRVSVSYFNQKRLTKKIVTLPDGGSKSFLEAAYEITFIQEKLKEEFPSQEITQRAQELEIIPCEEECYVYDVITGKIGRAFNQESAQQVEEGIGCFNGVLITPVAAYNIVQTEISQEYQEGEIRVEIPVNFPQNLPGSGSIEEILHAGIVSTMGVMSREEKKKFDNFHLIHPITGESRQYINIGNGECLTLTDFLVHRKEQKIKRHFEIAQELELTPENMTYKQYRSIWLNMRQKNPRFRRFSSQYHRDLEDEFFALLWQGNEDELEENLK